MNPDTIAAIKAHAKELADAAPELNTEQSLLLVSVFARYPERGAA